MNKNYILLVVCLTLSTVISIAQVSSVKQVAHTDNKSAKLPSSQVKTLSGKPFNTNEISNDGKPTVISFWATWCKPCVRELNAISEVYEDWQNETGVKVIAVSVDDARNVAKVEPFVNGKDWDFEILLDPNGDFKRALNVNLIPHTFLLNGDNEVVWQHNSYQFGDEDILFDNIQKVVKGEAIIH